MKLKNCTLGLALVSSAAFLPSYSFAVEPDVDSPAGPQNPALTSRPDFQQDDQAGAAINPGAEGAKSSPSAAARTDVGKNDSAEAAPESAVETSPGEENKGKPKVELE